MCQYKFRSKEVNMTFVSLISHFTFGQVLMISGETKKGCNNFKVNLSNDDDIPLAMFVNFKTQQIVMNTFIGGEWIEESTKISIESFPESRFFTFYVLASETQFHIAYNGKHISHYTFQPNINCVHISGEIKLVHQVDHRSVFPVPWPPLQENTKWTSSFSHDIPTEWNPGCSIMLRLKVSGSSSGKFHIKFNDRATQRQMFHFNIRLGEKAVVVNSMNDALEWMKETRIKESPVKLDKEFSLVIAMTSTCFKVAIDGRHYVAYEYRMIQIPKSSFNGHNQIFERLSGLKVIAEDGLKLQVLELDHTLLKEDCDMYEVLSNKNFLRKK